MKKLALMMMVALLGAQAYADDPKELTVGIYAPSVAFADSSARLSYVQGLAKAIEDKTGIKTTGKAYIRLSDLTSAKPDFAILEGLCIAAKSPGDVLAT